ncbi:MAG: formate dehydrogenase subunit gamma [Pseudomonadota bacterium]
MTKWFANLALGLSLFAAIGGGAIAQSSGVITPAPAAAPAAVSAAQPAASMPAAAKPGLPVVQSGDILNMKQNQAERSRDQPGNLSPTWRIIKEGTNNYSSLPALESGVLIQPKQQFLGQSRATTAGEAWRQYRNGPLTMLGGWLLILAVVGIAAVFLIFGPVKLKEGRTGRLIERFTSVERLAHWTVAITFVLLAFSGLLMLFGKHVILPLFGHTLFGWVAFACKNIHNFVGPVFTISLVVFFVIYVKDNLPEASDLKWLSRLGGLRGKGHVSAGRFNAGEKLWFWGGVVFLGLIVSASGLVLDMLVPGILYTRGNMQIANVIHLIGGVLIAAMSFAHIYIGTIGMEGAYAAMRTGYVDDTWAREHHDLWYDDVANGRVPRVRTEEGAAKIGVPVKAL